MKRVLKWLAIVVGGILLLAIITVVTITAYGGSRLNAHYDIQPAALTVSAAEEDVARARQLQDVLLGCTFCHGEDLGGGVVEEEEGVMEIYAPNLTAGAGGIGAVYSDEDLVRAIRHGVARDGKALILMPADQFSNLSERDLAAFVAYVRSFPPVDNEVPETTIGPFVRFFMALGQIPESLFVPARHIDHDAPFRPYVEPGETAEYGQYLTSIGYCTHCHRTDFQGGPFPFPDPEAPVVPNITSAGMPGTWTVDEFRSTLRTGITPAGRPLNPEYMDWPSFGQMSDEQLGAIYLYLQSLPPADGGSG